MRLTNLTLHAFKRAELRHVIEKMEGWTSVPAFVEAMSECDVQINAYCAQENITRKEFFSAYKRYRSFQPV